MEETSYRSDSDKVTVFAWMATLFFEIFRRALGFVLSVAPENQLPGW